MANDFYEIFAHRTVQFQICKIHPSYGSIVVVAFGVMAIQDSLFPAELVGGQA